jgi:hypothetical protein
MREIRFRGKRISDKEWAEGSLLIKGNKCWIINEEVNAKQVMGDIRLTTRLIPVAPETVGQYVEILGAYEGDLLQGEEWFEGMMLSSWIGLVCFSEEFGRIMIKDLYDEYVAIFKEDSYYEVDNYNYIKNVGNIWDNPEIMASCEIIHD